jgi:hypothetical protein
MQTFFSATVHALMPRIHNSEHAYGKRYKSSRQKFTQTDEIKDTTVIGFSKPGALQPVPPATVGALRAPVFYRLLR